MTEKSFRDKLRKKYGNHCEYPLNDEIMNDMKLVTSWQHEYKVIDGKLIFGQYHKMTLHYPITYSNFLTSPLIDPSKIDGVASVYTSPDEFFKGLVVQDTQTRLDGLVLNRGDSYESDTRLWVCLTYCGEMDRSKLCFPWWYDEDNRCYMLMLHGANSGLSKLRGMRR